MFGWFKKLLPKRPPEGAHELVVKELMTAVKFFGVDAVRLGTAMANRKLDVTFLLYELDGVIRRQALVGLLLKKGWIPQHRYDYILTQDGKADKLNVWFATGELPL